LWRVREGGEDEKRTEEVQECGNADQQVAEGDGLAGKTNGE